MEDEMSPLRSALRGRYTKTLPCLWFASEITIPKRQSAEHRPSATRSATQHVVNGPPLHRGLRFGFCCSQVWIKLHMQTECLISIAMQTSSIMCFALMQKVEWIILPCRLCRAADSNMAGEDGFDEKGCHCEIAVEDLLPSVKAVIRAVRWGEKLLFLPSI